MHVRWHVRQQKRDGSVNRFGIDDVVVVDDQDEIVRDGRDVIKQRGQN